MAFPFIPLLTAGASLVGKLFESKNAAPIVSAGASLLGAHMGNKAQQSANSTNIAMQYKANAANALEAEMARDWSSDEAAKARQFSAGQADQAYTRDTAAVKDARQWDRKQVKDARKYDAKQVDQARDWSREQVLDGRQWDRKQVKDARKYDAKQVEQAREWDRSQVLDAREWNAGQVAEGREWDRSQVLDAREWDAEQVEGQREWSSAEADKEREWNLSTSMAAERRGRDYAAADRDEYRAYSDPAAVRARLEAAGINPLAGVDASTAYIPGGGAFAPASAGVPSTSSAVSGRASSGIASSGAAASGRASSGAASSAVATTSAPVSSVARSGVASAQAASAGLPTGAAATFMAPQVQAAGNFGTALSGAVEAYSNSLFQQQEQALRSTQLDLEQTRIGALVEQSRRGPEVPGVYHTRTHSKQTHYIDRPVPSAPGGGVDPYVSPSSAPGGLTNNPHAPGRELDTRPMTNSPLTMEVDHPYLSKPANIPGIDGEPLEMDQIPTVFGPMVYQEFWNRTGGRMRTPAEVIFDWTRSRIEKGTAARSQTTLPRNHPMAQ